MILSRENSKFLAGILNAVPSMGLLMPGIIQIAKQNGVNRVVADVDGLVFYNGEKHYRIFSEELRRLVEGDLYHELHVRIEQGCREITKSPENVPESWKYLYGETNA